MSLTGSLSYATLSTPAVNERSRFEMSSVGNDDDGNNGDLPYLLDIPDELPSSGNTRLRDDLPLSLRSVRRRLQPRRSSPVNSGTTSDLHELVNSMVNHSSSQGLTNYEGATDFCPLPQAHPSSLNTLTLGAETPMPEFLALPELPSPSLFMSQDDEDAQIRREILQSLPMPPPLARLLPHPERPSLMMAAAAFPQDPPVPVESPQEDSSSSWDRPPPMIRLQRKPAVPFTPVNHHTTRPSPVIASGTAAAEAQVDNSLTGWLSLALNAEAQRIRAATATATATPPSLPSSMPPPSVYLPDMF